MYDVAIIGAGPAGLTAGIYAARAGLSVLILEKLYPGGQIISTHLLENYPGFHEGIGGADFSNNLREHALRFGAKLQADPAVSMELEGPVKRIQGSEGSYEARSVILALGAVPRKLGLDKEAAYTGAGISYCATCDGAFFRGREVCVVGGGDTALEDALYLSNLVKKVTIVHRREGFRAQQYLLDRAKQRENILFLTSRRPKAILGDEGFEGLLLENTQTGEEEPLTVDGCFVAVGQLPDTAIVKDVVALDDYGYILAGEDTKTNIPGVFAAGDARNKPLRQVVTAAADGAVAAMAAQSYLENQDTF